MDIGLKETLKNLDTLSSTEIKAPKPDNSTMSVAEKKYQEQKRISEIYLEQAEYIKKSQQLRADIAKAHNDGVGADELLKMAIECIYILTGDRALKEQF